MVDKRLCTNVSSIKRSACNLYTSSSVLSDMLAASTSDVYSFVWPSPVRNLYVGQFGALSLFGASGIKVSQGTGNMPVQHASNSQLVLRIADLEGPIL